MHGPEGTSQAKAAAAALFGGGDLGALDATTLSAALGEAGAVSFAAPVFRTGHGGPFDPVGLATLAAMAVGIGLASMLVVRGLTRPLRDLSAAADSIGHDAGPVRVPEEGPAEDPGMPAADAAPEGEPAAAAPAPAE